MKGRALEEGTAQDIAAIRQRGGELFSFLDGHPSCHLDR
jgi:hypothetical protein